MGKEQEQPRDVTSTDNRLKSVDLENVNNRAKRQWGLVGFVLGRVLATSLLTAIACGEQVSSTLPAPTVDPALLKPHNVPWVKINFEDKNGDGFYNRTDAHLQEEGNWRFDLNMEPDENGIFWIDEKDLNLVRERFCTKPVLPKYDVNLDGRITQKDADIIEANQGMVVEDPSPNERLDNLDGGIILDGNEQDISKRKHIRAQDTIQGSDPDCESDS